MCFGDLRCVWKQTRSKAAYRELLLPPEVLPLWVFCSNLNISMLRGRVGCVDENQAEVYNSLVSKSADEYLMIHRIEGCWRVEKVASWWHCCQGFCLGVGICKKNGFSRSAWPCIQTHKHLIWLQIWRLLHEINMSSARFRTGLKLGITLDNHNGVVKGGTLKKQKLRRRKEPHSDALMIHWHICLRQDAAGCLVLGALPKYPTGAAWSFWDLNSQEAYPLSHRFSITSVTTVLKMFRW